MIYVSLAGIFVFFFFHSQNVQFTVISASSHSALTLTMGKAEAV